MPHESHPQSAAINQELAVDFARLLFGLQRLGYGVDAIALHANLRRDVLRTYQTGVQPLHVHGERLVRLYCEVSGHARDDVPMMRASKAFSAR